jgi:hypothetical protein
VGPQFDEGPRRRRRVGHELLSTPAYSVVKRFVALAARRACTIARVCSTLLSGSASPWKHQMGIEAKGGARVAGSP